MLYKKYQQGGLTSGPKMTQSLARTLMEIEANTDLNRIKKAEKEIQDALMDEKERAEELGATDDVWRTGLGKLFGWGSALATEKYGGDKYAKYAPVAGSLMEMVGGELGAISPWAKDYKAKDIETLAKEKGIDLPSTKWHRNLAEELLETGKTGLSDIEDRAKKGRGSMRREGVTEALLSAPTYGEVVGGEKWLQELFGLGADTREEYPYTEVPMGTTLS